MTALELRRGTLRATWRYARLLERLQRDREAIYNENHHRGRVISIPETREETSHDH